MHLTKFDKKVQEFFDIAGILYLSTNELEEQEIWSKSILFRLI